MIQPQLKVVRNEGGNSADIMLYGIIGSGYDWYDDEFTNLTAKRFVRELSQLEKQYDTINVHIHSPGGDVWEGLGICNAIRASKKTVNTFNDGIAMSMGACILACGKNRFIAKGSITMIHNASTFSWGTAEQLREDAKMLDSTDDVLADFFADATGKTVEQIKADYFDHKDHFLTAKETEALGLAKMIELDAKDVPENISNMGLPGVAALYKNNSNPKNTNTDMSLFKNPFKGISALSKKEDADITDEMLETAQEELTAEGIKGVTLVKTSDLQKTDAAADKVPDLEKRVADLQAAAKTNETKIKELEAENKKLKEEPAAEASTPVGGNERQAGDGNDEVPESPTDAEYRKINEVRNLIP